VKYRAIKETALVRFDEKTRYDGQCATAGTSEIANRTLVQMDFDRQRHRAHVLDPLQTEKSPSGP